jgi:hypothetical protein
MGKHQIHNFDSVVENSSLMLMHSTRYIKSDDGDYYNYTESGEEEA